jgi:hypothetical protein
MGLVNLDVANGKVGVVELGSPIPLYSAVVSPDRKRAYAVMNQLLAIDLEKKRITQITDLERPRYVANISRDGKRLFVSGAAPFIHVYDTATLQLIKTVELPGDPSVTSLATQRGEPHLVAHAPLRAVFALLRTLVSRKAAGVHTSVNAARTSARATSIRLDRQTLGGLTSAEHLMNRRTDEPKNRACATIRLHGLLARNRRWNWGNTGAIGG